MVAAKELNTEASQESVGPPAAKQKQSEVPGNLSLAEGLRLKPRSLNSSLVKGFLSRVMFKCLELL